MIIKRYLKSATAKNAGWLVFGKTFQMLISFVVSLLTMNFLGPSNYGLINYAGAYTAFFMAFCTLGINSVLVKEFVDNPEEEGHIIGSSLVLRGISSLLSAGVIISIVFFADAGEKDTIAVVALCSIGVVFNIFETFNYWFQARLQSKVTAIVTLAAYAITSVYKVVLLALEKNVYWFAMASALDYICVGIMLLLCYRHYGGKRLAFSKRVSKRILTSSVHFIMSGLMVSVYRSSDKFMLKQMISETEVGYYSTATMLCTVWCFVLSAIIDSLYPSIMKAHKESKELFEKRNRQLFAIVFYVSAAVSVCICLFGKFAIGLVLEEYLPAVVPLCILTWHTGFSYLGVARNAWIVCENKGKYLKYIYALAAISNIVLNYLLIPLWGATGAAVATLVTQFLTSILVPFFIKGMRRSSVLMLEGIFFKGIR